jgi:hypothetical protein
MPLTTARLASDRSRSLQHKESTMADYTIFLSHRSKDALAAAQLRGILEGLDDTGALRVVVSEAIPKGDDWRSSIHKELAQADRFVLLYTDPSQKWDWCLYESGFFSGVRLHRPKPSAKFITLHAVDVEPPSPLTQWQTVKGDATPVRELLEELFCMPLRERAEPIAKKLKGSKRIKTAAERIATLIRPGPKPDWYSSFVRLILSPAQVEEVRAKRRIPLAAEIEADDSALDLFNVKRSAGLTWERLGTSIQRGDLVESNLHWRAAVSEAIYTALNGARSLPQLPMFYSHDGECYHSFLQRLDKMSDNSNRAYVVFTRFHGEDDPRPPGDLGILTHMLSLGRNFRWGVIEPFAQKLTMVMQRGSPPELITDVLAKLEAALARALNEGARAQLLVPEVAMAVFSDPNDRSDIARLYAQWGESQPAFEQAMASQDLKEIVRILEGYRKVNAEYLTVTVKRLYEILSGRDMSALLRQSMLTRKPASELTPSAVTQ